MKQKAFTLIELLVVIAIIGVIASIVLVNLRGTREKATVARGLSFSQSIYHALGAYSVGVYRFEYIDSGTGVSPDTSGYKNHLTNHLALCSLSSEGIINNAVSCSDTPPSCLVSSPTTIIVFSKTNEITIEAWFKLDSHDGNDGIVNIEGVSAVGTCVYQIGITPDLHPVYWPGAGDCFIGQWITNFTFELDKWYHYVMTIKGGEEAEIYINGKSVHKSSDGVPATLPDGGRVIVGSGPDCGGFAMISGVIDEVRIYDQAFSL